MKQRARERERDRAGEKKKVTAALVNVIPKSHKWGASLGLLRQHTAQSEPVRPAIGLGSPPDAH